MLSHCRPEPRRKLIASTVPVCPGSAHSGNVWRVTDAVGRVRPALPAAGPPAGMRQPDFACTYVVALAPGDTRSSEQWARTVWEEAPAPLRLVMLAGWKLVLRLRLGPRHSPDHILGWRITARDPDRTECRLDSPFLSAGNVFRTSGGRLAWSTFVTYDRPAARLIWPPAAPLHRLIVRIALHRAARR